MRALPQPAHNFRRRRDLLVSRVLPVHQTTTTTTSITIILTTTTSTPPPPTPTPSDVCREDYYLADSVDGAYDKTYVDKCQADDTGNGTACCSCPPGADCAEGSTIDTIMVLP